MNFDNNAILKYLNSSPQNNAYIFRLYRACSTILKLTDNNPTENEEKLRELEDSIYTYDGKILSDKIRIKIELENILSIYSNMQNENSKTYFDVIKLIDTVKRLDLDNPNDVKEAKKQISIVQAKLGLKTNFYLATYEAFMDIYKSLIFNNKKLDFNKNENDIYNINKNYYNEKIKKGK